MMIRLAITLLVALLLVPLTGSPVEAKVKAATAQVHVVKQGDSLYEIAQRHGLTVKQLKRLNGLNSNRLKIGQKLALDRAAAPPLPQAAKEPPRKAVTVAKLDKQSAHVVRKGDSLHTIARRHGMTVTQLQQLNGLSSNRLKIGQKLTLSTPSPEEIDEQPAAPETRRTFASVEQHVVRKGETLSKIARRHHLSIKELKRLNGLRGNNLKIGQRLALNDPEAERNPILLPGDSSDDEVIEMAASSDNELEKVAFNYLSTPYRFGGSSRRGIDCSAFVQQVFREMDVQLPRSAREQFRVGEKIERDQLQKGDLIFFRTYARFPSHVGIYLGDGKMIHASSRSRRVVVTSIDHPYYQKRFIGAKRISLLDSDEELDTATAQEDLAGEDEVEDVAAPVETAAVPVIDSETRGASLMTTPAVAGTADSAAVTVKPAVAGAAPTPMPASAPPVN